MFEKSIKILCEFNTNAYMSVTVISYVSRLIINSMTSIVRDALQYTWAISNPIIARGYFQTFMRLVQNNLLKRCAVFLTIGEKQAASS